MDVVEERMQKPIKRKCKPNTAADHSASRVKVAPNAIADWIQGLDEQAWRERLAWLAKPRLDTAIFEEIFKTEQIAKAPQEKWSPEAKRHFNQQKRQQRQKIREITQKFGWTKKRFDKFKSLAVACRNEPSIKHYLAIRTEFPELDIQIGFSDGIDALFILEAKFRQYGIDPVLVAGATDGFEPDIDKLCLALMECIVARDMISGPGQTQRRRATISDAMVNYLIALMLEGLDLHNEMVQVPASLILLVRHQLGPLKGDLHDEYRSREAKLQVARRVGQLLEPDGKLSINLLVKLASQSNKPISRATAARWLKDKEFNGEIQHVRFPPAWLTNRLTPPKK